MQDFLYTYTVGLPKNNTRSILLKDCFKNFITCKKHWTSSKKLKKLPTHLKNRTRQHLVE